MAKILCIDDTPEEILTSGQSLKETINTIFKDTPYKTVFKKTGKDGIKAASEDIEIKLAVLDVEFNKRIEGPQIADELQAKAPHVKVIILTRIDDRGKKISFGWKPNIVHYILKKEIAMPFIQIKLKNLVHAVIADFKNKNWILTTKEDSDSIILENKETGESYGVDIPLAAKPALLACMQDPNSPVELPTEKYGKNLNKVHNSINENVLEKTDWNTWGILTREGCAKGQLKLVIGCVMPVSVTGTPKDQYVTQSQFEMFLKDFETFKKKVLSKLDINKTDIP